jgi:hypothetical protein
VIVELPLVVQLPLTVRLEPSFKRRVHPLGVALAVLVAVEVGVLVMVAVGLCVAEFVGVPLLVSVAEFVGVPVWVEVTVLVGVLVTVRVALLVAVLVGVPVITVGVLVDAAGLEGLLLLAGQPKDPKMTPLSNISSTANFFMANSLFFLLLSGFKAKSRNAPETKGISLSRGSYCT